jgi:hypothetical protein
MEIVKHAPPPHPQVTLGRKWLGGLRHRKEHLIHLNITNDTMNSDYDLTVLEVPGLYFAEGCFWACGDAL